MTPLANSFLCQNYSFPLNGLYVLVSGADSVELLLYFAFSLFQAKRKKKEKESIQNLNKDPLPLTSESTVKNIDNCDDSVLCPDKNKKADKRKERKQKKKEKRALLKEQNHVHEGKGQGKAIRYYIQ